jgi:tetratricopeptide (TPR) repeat protein
MSPTVAINSHEQALATAQEKRRGFKKGSPEWTEARYDEEIALGNLGNAYFSVGELQTAVDWYEQQLEVAQAIGHRHGEGNACSGLGNAYLSLGEVQIAME